MELFVRNCASSALPYEGRTVAVVGQISLLYSNHPNPLIVATISNTGFRNTLQFNRVSLISRLIDLESSIPPISILDCGCARAGFL